MNQDKNDKTRTTKLMDENVNVSPAGPILPEKSILEMREKNKRGIGTIRGRPKHKMAIGQEAPYDQCFSGDNLNFTSQYEDESPVNYSLKYSETESCKAVKTDDAKKKYKDYSDYAEDQPTNFSLKYAEKTYDEENKNSGFNYYESHKSQFKEYTDYLETDLDQPTDFTLKYRESVEEEIKNSEFNFYENQKPKASSGLVSQREETAGERGCEQFTCEDETPLMFSRCSSMNSLSSFVHLTQSIPDDRSSVISDFSRMPSGIISPSELPDSPTQTAPSSPKRQKPSAAFLAKKSVFEDDVATYRQEDTPIEFSRTTSLSSLNIDSPAKSELLLKTSSTLSSLACAKEGDHISGKQFRPVLLMEEQIPEKIKQSTSQYESASGIEVDEGLLSDCISINIQKNGADTCEELQSQLFTPLHNVSPQSPNSIAFGESEEVVSEEQESAFISPKSHVESTIYWDDKASPNAPYDPAGSEDNINYTEERVEDSPRTEYADSENFDFDSQEPLTPFEEALIEQCIQWGMPHKNAAIEGGDFKVPNRGKISEEREHGEHSSPKITFDKAKYWSSKKLHSSSRTGSWVGDFDAGRGRTSASPSLNADNLDFDSNEPLTPFEEALLEQCIRLGMPQKESRKLGTSPGFKSSEGESVEGFDYDPSEQITPLETALLEQCIRLGMPQKKSHKRVEGNNISEEHNRAMSCATARLNKLRISSDNEKDNKKCDHFVCMCRRKHGTRRKTGSCGRTKKCRDLSKTENYKT